MFAVRELVIFGVIAFQSVCTERIIRSPDKMEVNIPTYTHDRDSEEFQENMNEEAAYWHGQSDKFGDKEEEGQQQLEEDRDKNQDNYEKEKDHIQKEENIYHKEMNETYQNDKNKTESHHESNQEHYTQNNNNNYDYHSQGNKTTDDLTESEVVDRYEEKGTEYKEEGQDKIENHDVNEDTPSFSYTKT